MSLFTKQKFDALSTTRQTHTAGAAITLADAKGNLRLMINPAATLAALAVTFPPNPTDGQNVTFHLGGTMTNGTVVTNLTVVANANQSVLEPAAPGAAAAGKAYAYRYDAALTKWFRIY